MTKRVKLAAFAVGALALIASPSWAQLPNKCQGAKIKGAGKKAACLAGLEAKVVGSGATLDPAKVAKCEAKVGAAYAKLEGKGGCNTTGDAGAIETKVDNFVDDVTAEESSGTLPNKCQGAKIKGAGKKAACLAGLQAKVVGSGATLDPAKVAKCEAKVGAAFAKLEGKGGCNTTGDAGAIETKVDNFVDDVTAEESATTTSSTSTTTGTTSTSTTTTTLPSCCPAGRISTTTSAGQLVVGTLTAFPFPAGVITSIDLAAGDSCCKHNAIVPNGGFTAPIFCITGLNFTSEVSSNGCESGTGDGNGVLWDGNGACTVGAGGRDADVLTVGDTRDGVCDNTGPCGIAAGGASNNTLGNIDTVVGNGALDPAGVQVALAIPVHSRTWSAADASCPDSDGMYNAGTDTLVSDFDFILRPTTATANASFVDQNADNCSRGAGTSGPNNTRSCSNNHARPCGANTDCVSPGTCGPAPNSAQTNSGALQGTPPAGPCCVPGQTETVVATGIAFSGGSPLFDLIFANSSPTTVSSCTSAGADTCTLSTDNCKF